MGRKTPDLAGQRFGRLTVQLRVPREPGTQGQAMWLCLCDCGNTATVGSYSLRRGNTLSCGCLRREKVIARSTTHGLTPRGNRPRAHSSWSNMMRRCYVTADPRYPDWGGRGIIVVPRWHDFANFFADMGERPPGTTLNRKNNDGPYAHWNCEWATPHEQQTDSRAFKLVPDVVAEIKRLRAAGLNMSDIAAQVGLHRQTVSRALNGKTRQRSKT